MRPYPTTWTYLPFTGSHTGSLFASWYAIAELWAALQERYQAAAGKYFPPPEPWQDRFKIESVISDTNGFTTGVVVSRWPVVGGRPLPVTNPELISGTQWTAPDGMTTRTLHLHEIDESAHDYTFSQDIILEPTGTLDPRFIFRSQITGNSVIATSAATGTITFSPVWTYGKTLVGGVATAIRRYAAPTKATGWWWMDRLPSAPNDTFTLSGTAGGGSATIAFVPNAGYTSGQYNGSHLYVWDTREAARTAEGTIMATGSLSLTGSSSGTLTGTGSQTASISGTATGSGMTFTFSGTAMATLPVSGAWSGAMTASVVAFIDIDGSTNPYTGTATLTGSISGTVASGTATFSGSLSGWLPDCLTFSGMPSGFSTQPGSRLVMGGPGLYWRYPNSPAANNLPWYTANVTTGYGDGVDTSGSATTPAFPSPTVTVVAHADLDPFTPYNRSDPLYDLDYFITLDLSGGEVSGEKSGSMRAPSMFMCIRGLQVAVENLISAFYSTNSYEGLRGPVYPFNGVSLLAAASIPAPATNAITGDTEVFWQTTSNTYDTYPEFTYTAVTAGVSITGISGVPEGATLRAWPRIIEREVEWVYLATYLSPATDMDGNPVFPNDTDTSTAGGWIVRPASTHTLEYSRFGLGVDGDLLSGLSTGTLLRYAGARSNDVYGSDEFSVKHVDQATIDPALLSGIVAAGGRGWIDSGQSGWWPWGVATTHSAGPSATYTSNVITDPKYAGTPWVDPATGRLKGFVVEIIQPGVSGGATGALDARRALISTSSNTGAITFNAITGLSGTYTSMLGTVTNTGSTSYQIREPKYRLGWWAGRTLILTPPGGAPVSVMITGSDDRFLFWDPSSTITPTGGWTWAISQFTPGEVLRFTGGSGGAGSFAYPTNAATGLLSRSISPDTAQRWGRARKWDLITLETFNSLYRAIKLLKHTITGVTWINTDGPYQDTNFYNAGTVVTGGDGGTGGTLLSDIQTVGDQAYQLYITDVPTGSYDPEPPVPSRFWTSRSIAQHNYDVETGGESIDPGGVQVAIAAQPSTAWVLGLANGLPGREFSRTITVHAKARDLWFGLTNTYDGSNGYIYSDVNLGTWGGANNAWHVVGSASGTGVDLIGPHVGGSGTSPPAVDTSVIPLTIPSRPSGIWPDVLNQAETRAAIGWKVNSATALITWSFAFV